MKKQTKKKIFTGILIGVMICSVLFILAQNGLATQDDSDIQATLHATLETNSGEIYSSLMNPGTYPFYDEPELDVGSFSHDDIRIDVTNLQYPTYNSTLPTTYNKNDGLTGNFTFNTTDPIEQYTLSAPLDTTIQVNISYERNYSNFYSLLDLYNIGALGGNNHNGITWDGSYFYVVDYVDAHVYKFPSDFSSLITSYNIGGLGGNDGPTGITWYSPYFYVVDYDDARVYKYPSDFSYLITSYNIGGLGGNDNPIDIEFHNSYFYITDLSDDIVYKYPSDFSSLITSYNIGGLGGNDDPFGICYYESCFYVSDYADARVYKYPSDFSSLITSYNIGGLGGNDDPRGFCWDGSYFYVVDYIDKRVYKYLSGTLFSNIYILNFTYQKLGIDYYENFTLLYDSDNSNFDEDLSYGYVVYYFDSSMFSQYSYMNDITIPEQNLTITIDLEITNVEINMSTIVSYSTCEWKVPTEVALTINSEEVIDSTYNSGWISLDTYPTSLVITSSISNIYFKLNITIEFSFTFNLDIISKTYLKKIFELESNHLIYIEQINFDSNLKIKKIYLNNVDKGSSNPCSLSPPVSMNTGNIYILEIILIESIYIPLQYLYNNLGSGTSNIYLSGISNTLTYSNINGNHLYSIVLPTDWHVEYAQFTFSDLEYLPDYTPNYSEDESGYGYDSSSYGNENVAWSEQYYQTNQNGSKLGESGNSGYENVYSEYFNALNSHMNQNNGSLDGHNNTYNVNDYLYMQNLFPTEFKYEDWLSWVHTYNSEYVSSIWDNAGVNLTSILNTGSELTVPEFTDFSFINGSHFQDGDLYTIDADYSTELPETSLVYNISFSVAGEDTSPVGIAKRNEYYYMLGASHKRVYRYYENFTYEGTSYDLSLDVLTPYGMTYDGSYFWIADNTGDMLKKFNSNFVYTGTGIYVGGQATNPVGILKLGSYYYVSDRGKGMVYKYTSAGAYTGTSFDINPQDSTPRGLYYDGTYIYISGQATLKIYKYTTAWSYTGVSFYVGGEDNSIWQSFKNSTNWCVLGSGNDAIFMYEEDLITELNFTSQIVNIIDGIYSNETIESYTLFYSYKTDESIEISFSIWNFDLSRWDLINQSINTDNFFNFNFTLNSSYYDLSYNVTLKFEGNGIIEFKLYIDKLVVQINWTKTSGEIYSTILKDIDFSFLNLYDSISSYYQLLYNVTLEFCYRYSNYTGYFEYANFTYDGNDYPLIKDENWHTISLNFEFDSLNIPSFAVMFNITNGLLELNSNLNYSIFFKCLLNTSYYDNFPDNLNWESVGTTGTSIGWVDQATLLGGEAIIVGEWQDHKNVLRLSNVVGQTPFVVHALDTPATNGAVELYIGSSDVSKEQQWLFLEPTAYNIFLRIKNSKLYYVDNVFADHEIQSVVSARWYHIKVVWRADNTYDIYVDTIKKVDNVGMIQNQVVGISALIVQTNGGSGTYYSYTDAPSEVSDPRYEEGDNLRMREVNEIYQMFRYSPSLSLDSLQSHNGNWILNFTYDFTASSDSFYNFYNSFNHSLLSFQIYVNTENGWEDPICFNYNTSQSNVDFTYNLTQYIISQGASQFNDFYLEIYLSGNPSNFTLDNLTLSDFDSDFYEVSAVWISDTFVLSHQNVSVYWIASDRHIEHIEITQEFDDIIYSLYNGTLLNNTLQSFEFWNVTCGFYQLNLTFYDNYSNWEKWTCNFTIWSGISISTAYRNPIFINEINTISVHIDTEYSIIKVWYDNSSSYTLEYDNSSYPIYQYEFNFTYSSSVETIYNISIKVLGEYNDIFYCNISLLTIIDRTTMLDIINLYSSYYQDEQMNITFNLRDLYNLPVQNKLLNYTIEDPNGNMIVNGSGITNSYGNITYNLLFDISYEIGFYHLNVSFADDNNYTGVWRLQSFQLRPILRTVNSTDINLKVNNHPVLNNYIQLNWTNNFTLTNYNTSTFDMSITLKLNYTESISYTQYLTYTYTFGATSDILSLTFDNCTLFNYPANFTDYYYDNAKSSNYITSGNRFTISDLIGDTFYNNNYFSLLFTYLDTSQIERTQLTKEPRTDTPEVQFREYLTANRSFSYWYFHNSLNISSARLYHNRTGTTISYSSFTIENSNYYFEKACNSGDLFTATMTYWIDWDDYVSYEVLTQNGTYCEVKVTYQAPFLLRNVTIVLDLNADNLYAENWSHNGIQSLYTFTLEIPHINFTTTQQTFTLIGRSSIPYSTFKYFVNEDDYEFNEDNYDDDDNDVWYRGYLKFPYYSQAFITQGRNTTWVLDGIHYARDDYDITSTGYFECPGWGSGISSAYLRFKAHPIGRVERYVNYERDYIEVVYRINVLLDLQNAEFEFYIENDEAYTITDIFFEGDEVDNDEFEQVKLYKLDGKDYYILLNLDLERGVNKIHIRYQKDKLENNAGQFLLVILALVFLGLCAWRMSVITKITKEAKEREEKLKRSDLIFLFFFMPHRISNEKVKRRLEKNKKKGKPPQKSWEELKEQARKLKLKKTKEKADKKEKKKEKKKNKKKKIKRR